MVFMMFGSMLLSNPVLPLVDADLIPPGKAYFQILILFRFQIKYSVKLPHLGNVLALIFKISRC